MPVKSLRPYILCCFLSVSPAQGREAVLKVWEVHEITLQAAERYGNPYTEVEVWVELKGPGFSEKVRGFWDGGNTFRIRVVATAPGAWSWTSGAGTDDPGLRGKSGTFRAEPWTEREKEENPNRRGFVRSTRNGRALQYADGTPFFLVADTWWAASTWRYPFKGEAPDPNYAPGPGIGFEEAVQFRKNQGYNSIGLIASFPNWDTDGRPATLRVADVTIRNAWENFDNDYRGAKSMHDEKGNRPFFFPGRSPAHADVCADFDRINPAYFQSLDVKMRYFSDQGFVPLLETVRRDHAPSWAAWYDWPASFARYVGYIAARYGAYNMIFSAIHFDWFHPQHSLTGGQFNEALNSYYEKYGPLPFGQPVTAIADGSTLEEFGHGESAPWLTMHGAGNKYRDHRVNRQLEDLFRLPSPYPFLNQEPYYPGWHHSLSRINGEQAEKGGPRDDYFGRAQMYSSVLSGGLAGHVYGTGAYDGTTTGERRGPGNPHIWEALLYASGGQMGHMKRFFLSEGRRYQDLELASDELHPRVTGDATELMLDGWAYMMKTRDRRLAFIYFENGCRIPVVHGLVDRRGDYDVHWFDPITGEWLEPVATIPAKADGTIALTAFPDGTTVSMRDWALKLVRQ